METIDETLDYLTSIVNSMSRGETPGLYLDLINKYLEDGSLPELDENASSLLRYVVDLMDNPFIQVMVFSSPLMAIVFRETTIRYVLMRIHQMNFQRQRAKFAAREILLAYQYSPKMRGTEWESIVTKVSEQLEDFGFDKKFMENLLDNDGALEPQKWNKLIIDWATALQRKMVQEDIDKENSHATRSFRPDEFIFTAINEDMTEYMRTSTSVDIEAMEQSLNLMHGNWSRSGHERVLSIIRRQRNYPSIDEVVNKMGRISDDEGSKKIYIATGRTMNIEHSAGCDIDGITSSRQLSGLLPIELAYYSDEKLSDVFLYKYVQGNLQSFRFLSNIAKPTHKLNIKVNAKTKGPMIVCVDMSGSMYGEPFLIVESLLTKIVWMANKQFRRCFLIYYTTSIQTLDLQLSNWTLNDLRAKFGGGTDATEMLTEVFRLLSNDDTYMCADVLWISDFIVPEVEDELLEKMKEFQKLDNRFYGYQIGGSDTLWNTRLDKMYYCPINKRKRYI